MTLRRIMIFSRYERIQHWTRMILIVLLMLTGFGLHGFYDQFDFEQAVTLHIVLALALVVLWFLSIFWHLTTGTWKQYVVTVQELLQVARYYAFGIFRGERHPYRKAYWRKHNPLQTLAYLILKLVLFPVIWISGIAYLLYFAWRDWPNATAWLEGVALIHTGAAFLFVVFVIVHIYLLTTGHSFWEEVRPMVDGFDEVDLLPDEEAYLERHESGKIR